jgi:hypothetical protein
MLQRILMTLVMAGLATVAGAETVYKWVDSSGQVHYTDVPPRQPDAKILDVFEQAVGDLDDGADAGSEDGFSDGADDDGNDGSSDEAGTATPRPTDVSDAMLAAARTDAERAKAEQCKLAQDRYKQYIEARRLFREQDGKRVYLTDKQLDEARAQAKLAVDDYCS